jgi:16S rRNA (guanine527-N7)-methyltransferase
VKDFDARLASGAAQVGAALDPHQRQQMAQLVDALLRWNKAFNLTAITDPLEVLTHHLLDSLAAQADLAGRSVADVGTGAGFPGLPLAIVNPERQFTLIDSVDKKLRFVDHAARELGLANVRTQHGRVEQLRPGVPFDTVIARAFAPLPRMAAWITPLCGPATRVVAMKGRWPPPGAGGADVAASGGADAAVDGGALPAGWRIDSVRPVQVPGLDEARHHVILHRAG